VTGRESLGAMALAEVAAVLIQHGGLICRPSVEEDEGLVTLTVTIHPHGQGNIHDALESLELMNALHYLQDVATLRALCSKYDIAAARLEALLFKTPDAP